MSGPTPESVDQCVGVETSASSRTKESQLTASRAVRAGAGAGKTTNLTEQVIGVAEEHLSRFGKLPQIMVTTFTRKATEELRERIVAKVFAENRTKLFAMVQQKSHLHISTLHGVFSSFLRQYGHLLGLESGFQVVDGDSIYRRGKILLHDLVKDNASWRELVKNYSFDQLLEILLARRNFVAEFPDSSVCDLSRLQMDSRSLVDSVLEGFLSLTRAIASESDSQSWVEYAQLLLAQNLSQEESPFEILEKIKSLGRKPNFSKKKPPFSEELKNEWDGALKKMLSLLEKPGLDPKNYSKLFKASALIDDLGRSFDEAVNADRLISGQLSSDDLEYFTLAMVRQHPGLAKAFSQQWDHWLVDEFQDTSPLQVEIMELLRGEAPVYMVGDPQQSIYLFRGARVEVFDKEEKRILAAGGVSTQLVKNYRSRPELLSAINDLVAELGDGFSPMEARDENFKSDVEVLRVLHSPKGSLKSYQGMLEYIQEKIIAGADYGDFCVLARSNKILQAVARSFEEASLPVCVHAASGFYARREVMDLLSLLKFLVNPHDDLNFVRLVRSPWFFLPDEVLFKIDKGHEQSQWRSLVDCEPEASHVVVQRLKKALAEVHTLGYIESFRLLVMESSLVDFSHWHDATGRRESNIWKLIWSLRQWERTPGFNPVELFRRFEKGLMALDEESDAVASKEPNRVNLMTVHKSKGLKFKYILLPHMEKPPRTADKRAHQSLFVGSRTRNCWSVSAPIGSKGELKTSSSGVLELEELAKREAEENWRLLYVAITRAEEGLVFHAEGDSFPEHSWAGRLGAFQLSPGVHRRQRYSLRVCSDFETTDGLQEKSPSSLAKFVREPFQYEIPRSIQSRYSVTSVVEARFKLEEADTLESDRSIRSDLQFLRAPSRGSVLHNVLERMKYRADFDFKNYLERTVGDEAKVYAEAIEYVLDLASPPMRELIAEGEVEWGFQVKTEDGIMEGQIDLWGQVNGEVWVVDYKSGSPKHMEKAFFQLELYAKALQKAYGFSRCRLAVVYPLAKKCVLRSFADGS